MDLEEIDQVLADDLDTGDTFRWAGDDYEVLSVNRDDEEKVVLRVNCLTDTGSEDEISLDWADSVILLGLTGADLDD